MVWQKDAEIHPERNLVVRLFQRVMRTTPTTHGARFFVKTAAGWAATPLFIALIVVETSDIIFAIDSIPAILAITTDPFIVYTSNVFAILGLRSLYFAVAGVLKLFHHLHYGLAAILVFVGGKMAASDAVHVSALVSLLVIGAILAITILSSLAWPKRPLVVEQVTQAASTK